MKSIREHAESPRPDRTGPKTTPLAAHWIFLVMLLGLVATEWLLRKRWDWM
jgi:hypothetical protein